MNNKLHVYILLILALLFVSSCGKEENNEPREFNPEKYVYHDDVAWVQLYDSYAFGLGSTYSDLVCIDKSGKEIFSMTDVNIKKVSNFANGIALVDGKYIIDKSGNIIHNLVEELNVTIIMFPRHRVEFEGYKIDKSSECYFDGFIFVSKNEGDITKTGMLNSNLEWVVEPTAKFKGMEPTTNYLYYNSIMGYYDALTNEFVDKGECNLRHMMRCFPKSGIIFLYHEGNNKFVYSSGEIKGKIYLENLNKTGFYNQDLELLIDLSEYRSVMALSDFKNDKCLIKFEDIRGQEYVGLINLQGKFIFVKTGYREYDSEKIVFSDCYFDWDGNCFKY